MGQVPSWYQATTRDRLFLVSQGVPFDTAMELAAADVLEYGRVLADLCERPWIHPAARIHQERPATVEIVNGVLSRFGLSAPTEAAFAACAEALQDATHLEVITVALPQTYHPNVNFHVRHPSGDISCGVNNGRIAPAI